MIYGDETHFLQTDLGDTPVNAVDIEDTQVVEQLGFDGYRASQD
jgi:hypothetical protein